MSWILWILASTLAAAIVVRFALHWYVNARIARAARSIVETSRRMYEQRHEFRETAAGQFPLVDRAFYDDRQRELEARGFRLLGDIEDVTATTCMPEVATFLRLMTSADATVLALIWQAEHPDYVVSERRVVRTTRTIRMVEFGTEFSDGTFLSTSPISNAAGMDAPPQVRRFFVPTGTEADEILRRHLEHVARRITRDPDSKPCQVASIADAFARFHRSQDLMIAHRQEVGLLTDDELDNLGRNFNRAYLELIKQAIRRYERRAARSNSAT